MRDRYVDGDTLRMIRIRAQRAQKTVAQQAGVSNWHLCEIENNRAYCSDMLALRLADILNCDVADFTRPGSHPNNADMRVRKVRYRGEVA